MKEPEKLALNVKSKDDFIKFIGALINDLKNNPEDWENNNLEAYLEALQAWTEDFEQYYINTNQNIPENVSWDVFTNILIAAKMYE